jgi:hypothetical protein
MDQLTIALAMVLTRQQVRQAGTAAWVKSAFTLLTGVVGVVSFFVAPGPEWLKMLVGAVLLVCAAGAAGWRLGRAGGDPKAKRALSYWAHLTEVMPALADRPGSEEQLRERLDTVLAGAQEVLAEHLPGGFFAAVWVPRPDPTRPGHERFEVSACGILPAGVFSRRELVLPAENSLLAIRLADGQPHGIADLRAALEDKPATEWPDLRALRGLGFESLELVPVLREGRAVALLKLLGTAPGALGAGVEKLYARNLAAIVGLTLNLGHAGEGALPQPPAQPPALPPPARAKAPRRQADGAPG